ncbi:metallophosphoesterase family protein [Vagococcus silagei]|uniref:Metallophosphoesterase n=1 Tax=Vagococcus silagei TaxID=2508885 RepID=A0A4S3B786_9ENTE|nr:metallophosphoesterase family protein [Vagococcus silagei]THB60555.1 metallophosphoesterase [Vagococcus silagei]
MKQKIALFSDIHGNLTALEAVIADSKGLEATDYWVLGDVLMHGGGASEIFELLNSLNPSVWVKGNWDDLLLVVLNQKDDIDVEDASDVYVTRLGMNLLSRLTEENLKQLEMRPMCETKTVNGLKFSISHNLPDKNFGGALYPTAEQEGFDSLFVSETTDVAVYGHIHHQLMRYSSSEQLIINPGSIGYPFNHRKSLRQAGYAHYAILEIDVDGALEVNFKQVKYDVAKELKRSKEINLPYLQVYKETLAKGTTRTHDLEFLSKINKEYGYKEEVITYLQYEQSNG